jgi:hypothetical protein
MQLPGRWPEGAIRARLAHSWEVAAALLRHGSQPLYANSKELE